MSVLSEVYVAEVQDQARIQSEGNSYLDSSFPDLSRIDAVTLMAPPPPSPGAVTSKETVVLTLTASGSIGDYSDTSSLQQSIATAASVDKFQVMVSVAAASVIITATITVPASTTAAAVQTSLSSSLGTAAAASAALGITVESDPAISLPVSIRVQGAGSNQYNGLYQAAQPAHWTQWTSGVPTPVYEREPDVSGEYSGEYYRIWVTNRRTSSADAADERRTWCIGKKRYHPYDGSSVNECGYTSTTSFKLNPLDTPPRIGWTLPGSNKYKDGTIQWVLDDSSGIVPAPTLACEENCPLLPCLDDDDLVGSGHSTQTCAGAMLAIQTGEIDYTCDDAFNTGVLVKEACCVSCNTSPPPPPPTVPSPLSPPPPPAPGVIELGELCSYTDSDLANDGDCSGSGPKSSPGECFTLTDEFLNTCKANEDGGANKITCDSTGVVRAVHANADCSDDVSTRCVFSLVGSEWSSPSGCFFRYNFDTCTEMISYLGQGLYQKYTGTCPEDKEAQAAQLYGLAIGVPVGICLLAVAIGAAIYWLKRRKQLPTSNAPAGRSGLTQIDVIVSDSLTQPKAPANLVPAASTDRPDTKKAAAPESLAALLAACGLEHRAKVFEDEGYTLENLLSAMKQGGEESAMRDLRELKLSLGECRQLIAQLGASM